MNYVRPYLKNDDDDSDDDDDECMIKTELAAACHSQRRPQEAGEQAGEIHFKGQAVTRSKEAKLVRLSQR